jgi:hypothetical protein
VAINHQQASCCLYQACLNVKLLLLLQVRPIPLEASMLQAAWGSNPMHHLLASYQVNILLRWLVTMVIVGSLALGVADRG